MMTTAVRMPIRTAVLVGAIACSSAWLGAPAAVAQPADAAAPAESQEITIVAPEVVRMQTSPPRMQQRRRRSVEVVSTTQQVSFADLDLSRPEDVATLRQRIRDASREACHRLTNAAPAYRTSSRSPAGCEKKASMEALALATDLAAAARGD